MGFILRRFRGRVPLVGEKEKAYPLGGINPINGLS
jgi:hypothetical protein